MQAYARPLVDTQRLLLGEHLITCQGQLQAPYSLAPTASVTRLCPLQHFQCLYCQDIQTILSMHYSQDPNIARSQVSRLAVSNLGSAPK